MARGIALGQLVHDLRMELRLSPEPSVGELMTPQLIYQLNNAQDELWMDYDWPHKRGAVDVSLREKERFYDFPEQIEMERVEEAFVKWDGWWIPITRGMDPTLYNARDSEECETDRPVLRWEAHNGDQFEVWPMPSANCDTIRFRGILNAPAMLALDDVCELDSNLLVKWAAWKMAKASDRQTAEREAKRFYGVIRARYRNLRVVNMNGGTVVRGRLRRHRYDYISNKG